MIKKCYSDQSSDAWTKKAVSLWNKAKEDSYDNLNNLKAEVGVITKKISSEQCPKKAGLFQYFAPVDKVTAFNKQPVELNTTVGKNDDILATSISEVLAPPKSGLRTRIMKICSILLKK